MRTWREFRNFAWHRDCEHDMALQPLRLQSSMTSGGTGAIHQAEETQSV